MARFGVRVEQDGWRCFVVPAGSSYTSPGVMAIEGDASTAAYFMAIGAIGGGPVRIRGVGDQSIQGDVAFAETVEAMGARVVRHANEIEVRGVRVADGEKLRAFDQDRSEEHTSELQSLMRISYAVFCLKKKKTNKKHRTA